MAQPVIERRPSIAARLPAATHLPQTDADEERPVPAIGECPRRSGCRSADPTLPAQARSERVLLTRARTADDRPRLSDRDQRADVPDRSSVSLGDPAGVRA